MKSIFKNTFASYIFAFAITAIFMTVSVNAKVYTEDVKLTEDMSETIEIVENAKVTIDLNKQTLDVKSGHGIVVNKGAEVTIKGEGKVLASKSAVFNNGGTVIIENGTFFSSTFYAVKNLGTMTIKGGLFTQQYGDNTGNSSLIANGFYGNSANDCGVAYPKTDPKITLTIEGGEFYQTTTTSTIKGDDWSKTIINNGKFTSTQGYVVQASGNLFINGGTFKGYDDIAVFNGKKGDVAWPGNLTITGGSFDANYVAYSYGYGNLTIEGGDFTKIAKGLIAAGKTLDYTVTGGTFAAKSDIGNYITDEYSTISYNGGLVVEKTPEFKLNKTSYLVEKGAEIKLDYTANDIAEKYFAAKSGDEKVATVNGKTVTAVSVGTTTIKVGYADYLEDVTFTVYEVKSDDATKAEEKTINTVIETLVKDETAEVKGIDKDTSAKLVEAVKAGQTIETELVADEVEAKEVTEETVKVIEKVLEGEEKVAAYFDVNVLLKANKETIGKITELDNKVKVEVAMPTTLPTVKEGYTRNYYVIRVHDGETTKLDVELVDGKLVFETDRFSTYALAYNDVKNNEVVNPQTLDNVNSYVAIAIISLVSLAGVTLYITKKSKQN